jgi:hypothetical protein
MKTIISLIVFAISILMAFGQNNFFVSPTGNNANNGSLNAPWQTIQYGLNQLSPGDTLNLMTGTYNEKIEIPVDNIYLRNYPGNSPIIDATGITTQNPVILLRNRSNITIEGLEIKNNIQNDAQGILIEGTGNNITIKNCVVHDIHFSANPDDPVNETTNAQGIIVYGTDPITPISNLKIIGNKLYNCRLGYSEGIAVNGNVDGFEITKNEVYNLTNIGIDIIGHEGTCSNPTYDQARNGTVKGNIVHNCISPYATSAGIYVDGGKNIVIENNISYHNGYGIEIGCENVGKTTDSIIARSNILYDNEISALALGGFDYPNGSGKVTNSIFCNNTCYYNDYSNSGTGEIYLSYNENTVIENNIFYVSTQGILAYAELTQPGLTFNYNVFFAQSGSSNFKCNWNGNTYTTYADFVSGTATNANSIFSDPQFVNANVSNPNFHIQATSPCINAGDPNYTAAPGETDIDNEVRTNGRVDCGADEYYSNTGISDHLNTEPEFELYPNPAHAYFTIKTKNKINNIEVYNSIGQLQKINTDQSIYIDISEWSYGIYFVRIKTDKGYFTKKIMKE